LSSLRLAAINGKPLSVL